MYMLELAVQPYHMSMKSQFVQPVQQRIMVGYNAGDCGTIISFSWGLQRGLTTPKLPLPSS